MTHQEYVLKMLHILKSVWLPARGWIYTIEKGYADQGLIKTLSEVIQHAIKITVDAGLKEKLKTSLRFLKYLNKKEEQSKIQDDNDLVVLEKMLDEI